MNPPLGTGREWAGRLLVLAQFGLLAWMFWRAGRAPPGQEAWAGILLAASMLLGLWALAANRPGNFNIRPTPRRDGALVQHGPYRWIRHPMYTAVLLAAAAAAWRAQAAADALLWLALLAVLRAKAGMEERALSACHPEYRAYMARTARFLPWRR